MALRIWASFASVSEIGREIVFDHLIGLSSQLSRVRTKPTDDHVCGGAHEPYDVVELIQNISPTFFWSSHSWKIVRPSRSIAATQPQLHPVLLKLSAMISVLLHETVAFLSLDKWHKEPKRRRSSEVYIGANAASNGVRLREGHCAVDPKKIPYGCKVVFRDAECVAVDSGPDVVNRKAARSCGRSAAERNAVVIDRFFDAKQKALAWAKANPHFMTVRVRTPGTEAAY